MESKFIPVRGNPSSPTKNTNYPFGVIGIFLCAEDGVEVYPRQGKSIFPHQKYRLSFWTVGIFLFREDAQTLGKCTELRSPPSTPRRKTAHDPPAHTVGGFLLLRPPSRSRCAQARGQLPPRQAAHERVKAIGTHRQPAVRARPQVRIFPRRQRRKTHLASPHLHSSLPAAKLLCIWITFALSLYSLE